MTKLAQSLRPGDEVRIIAPSDPLELKKRRTITGGFAKLGLQVSFADACFDKNAGVWHKLDDLHMAFKDTAVKAVFAGTGGFSCNRLIDHIDYGLIKNRPKIFCGYSDITVLLNAIYAKTGLVTYHGPNASGVGSLSGQDFTHDFLRKCLFSRRVFELGQSRTWFDKDYLLKHPREKRYDNQGWWIVNGAGIVEGTLVGGNLSCLSLLSGTSFSPSLKNAVLMLEDDYESQPHDFAAKFQALTQQPNFRRVQAVVFGRFQPRSRIDRNYLYRLVASLEVLKDMPIIANIDIGHTKPQLTLPVGGIVQVKALKDEARIKVIEH